MKKLLLLLAITTFSATLMAADFVIYPNSVVSQTNSFPTCPGMTTWHAVYAIPLAQGWGWAPDTNGNTVFSVSITNRPGAIIQYAGQFGDANCGTAMLSVLNPPPSPKYRFTQWGTGSIPTSTNQCGIVLHNFKP